MEETLITKPADHNSTVDTSRPFRSVKEAVAIFGERILAGEIYSSAAPSPNFSNNNYLSPQEGEEDVKRSLTNSPDSSPFLDRNTMSNNYDDRNRLVMEAVKRLESELAATKAELKVLKEREEETEVAVASLNAELHKNMAKMAAAEAAAAKAGAAGTREEEEEMIRRELVRRMEKNTTLAQILSLGHDRDQKEYGRRRGQRMTMMRKSTNKKKPIVPLVGDLFSRKKY
ncbi:WEB family protein At3g51220 [Humulus lupulus]|uniref:WEB family protein At3g51220 n=1 Tax=Humulus lupulus TaxID=3486 RepID=UPI002B40B25A|nr:WEB family protein At3g51220 [Humulus lupulus]